MSVVAIPPDRLYFALLDAPIARGRARTEELGYAFEASLPCPLESVHAVYRSLSDGRVLAVGLSKTEAASLPPEATAAHPQRWPTWVDGLNPSPPQAVNLLSGEATPASIRRQRSSIAHVSLFSIAAIAAVLSVGIERRIGSANQERSLASEAVREVYATALGERALGAAQPPAAMMTAELRRLRATRQTESLEPTTEADADNVLAALLTAWPDDTEPQTESITIAERSVELILRVRDVETAQRFVTALGSVPGLSNASSSTAQDRDGIRLSLRLDRGVTP